MLQYRLSATRHSLLEQLGFDQGPQKIDRVALDQGICEIGFCRKVMMNSQRVEQYLVGLQRMPIWLKYPLHQ
jgi:hypothetical protein